MTQTGTKKKSWRRGCRRLLIIGAVLLILVLLASTAISLRRGTDVGTGRQIMPTNIPGTDIPPVGRVDVQVRHQNGTRERWMLDPMGFSFVVNGSSATLQVGGQTIPVGVDDTICITAEGVPPAQRAGWTTDGAFLCINP